MAEEMETLTVSNKGNKAPKVPESPKRVRVILDEGGEQDLPYVFISLNGVAYKVQRGVEVELPVELLEILDHAVMTVMVKDQNNRYTPRKIMRFPYRVLREAA